MTCDPAELSGGIVFESANGKSDTPVSVRPGRRSTVQSLGGSVETVEHLMAAIWAMGISNLKVTVKGPEIPILDGSSLEFMKGFENAGVVDQGIPRPVYCPEGPLFVSEKNSALLMLPDEMFRITYTLDYASPVLPSQLVDMQVDPERFKSSLAGARTFCTQDEAEKLLRLGYGRGATYKNTLVMGPQGPKENSLRFEDECARHKVLDLIGDLSLLGLDFKAHVIGVRSGHHLNQKLRSIIQENVRIHDNA